MSAVGIDDGAESRGIDRYEELTCEGEKPLTTLVVLRSELPLAESEDTGCTEPSKGETEAKGLLSTTAGVVGCCVGSAVC